MVSITEALILAKSKVSSLDQVKHLNMWGSNIDELSILQKTPNLNVLSLSVNQISDLSALSNCPKLTELYLRKNQIQSKHQLDTLAKLPNLKVLWLSENPVETLLKLEGESWAAESQQDRASTGKAYYRTFLANLIPTLEKLDDEPITPIEKTPLKIERQTQPKSPPSISPRSASPLHSRRVSGQNGKQTWATIDETKVKTNIRSLAGLRQSSLAPALESNEGAQHDKNGNILLAINALLNNLNEQELTQVIIQCQQHLSK